MIIPYEIHMWNHMTFAMIFRTDRRRHPAVNKKPWRQLGVAECFVRSIEKQSSALVDRQC